MTAEVAGLRCTQLLSLTHHGGTWQSRGLQAGGAWEVGGQPMVGTRPLEEEVVPLGGPTRAGGCSLLARAPLEESSFPGPVHVVSFPSRAGLAWEPVPCLRAPPGPPSCTHFLPGLPGQRLGQTHPSPGHQVPSQCGPGARTEAEHGTRGTCPTQSCQFHIQVWAPVLGHCPYFEGISARIILREIQGLWGGLGGSLGGPDS